jgi:hypothetical protein
MIVFLGDAGFPIGGSACWHGMLGAVVISTFVAALIVDVEQETAKCAFSTETNSPGVLECLKDVAIVFLFYALYPTATTSCP